MTILGKCYSCGKRKFIIKKRNYTINNLYVQSNSELCVRCFKVIKKLSK